MFFLRGTPHFSNWLIYYWWRSKMFPVTLKTIFGSLQDLFKLLWTEILKGWLLKIFFVKMKFYDVLKAFWALLWVLLPFYAQNWRVYILTLGANAVHFSISPHLSDVVSFESWSSLKSSTEKSSGDMKKRRPYTVKEDIWTFIFYV